MKDQWINDPFPYLIVDNFLEKEDFNSLTKELDQTKQQLQNNFKTPLESKLIFKDTLSKKVSKRLVDIMASTNIKDIISQQVGTSEIISMAENKSFSGYSPYHITENNGFLGTHVDHSFVDDGNLRHIANTIYYASSKWVDGWGGQTIFFSRNGYLQDVLIDPIPNRLVFFIHTANSFHGVKNYFSNENIERRTFYHDYYVAEENITKVMDQLNKNRKSKLLHFFHGTTFIPFIPFGLSDLDFKKIINIKNLKYIPVYIAYLSNRFLGTKIVSLKKLFKLKKSNQ
ncbi:MAG: hypothetical protein CMQ71_00420 [Gammaproteobacteria bacterium]|nr:hypothetical protein [Gammaproteobacteria bacterium]|tara:strand:- start:249 stop:1103 length:855 start_codon:yes stop_codon:yes gene_type:complete